MTFHDKLGRYAGGFADYIFRDATDFDGLGRGDFKKAENIDLLEREDEDDKKGKGMLDKFLLGLASYDPEKNKTESDEFLDKMASRGFASGGAGGSFTKNAHSDNTSFTSDTQSGAISSFNLISQKRPPSTPPTTPPIGPNILPIAVPAILPTLLFCSSLLC